MQTVPDVISMNADGYTTAIEIKIGHVVERGAFIVFEGIDRCGKSTQLQSLCEFLQERGHRCVVLRFPDRTTLTGKVIDGYLQNKHNVDEKTLHRLFCDNRWEFNNVILDGVERGETVIADRYAYSGIAYSVCKGLDHDWCKRGDTGLLKPDKVFYLDIQPEHVVTRGGYGKERYEKLEFQQNVYQAFEKFRTEDNWKPIDASKQIHEIQEVIAKEAIATIEEAKHKPIQVLW